MCIQTISKMSKGKNFKSDNFILSLRLKGAEALRFWAVLDIAKSRNAYAERTDVIRELLGLDELNLLTADDMSFFRSGKKTETENQPVTEKPVEPERAKFVNLSPDSSIPQARKPSKIKKAS
jgi:hypothetical protein